MNPPHPPPKKKAFMEIKKKKKNLQYLIKIMKLQIDYTDSIKIPLKFIISVKIIHDYSFYILM